MLTLQLGGGATATIVGVDWRFVVDDDDAVGEDGEDGEAGDDSSEGGDGGGAGRGGEDVKEGGDGGGGGDGGDGVWNHIDGEALVGKNLCALLFALAQLGDGGIDSFTGTGTGIMDRWIGVTSRV